VAITDISPAVFVVDDDASVRDGVRTLLRSVVRRTHPVVRLVRL
jgi:FixJ family two-component response regulator